ncbi:MULTISPECIES: CAP domain-containing protein [unclassified Microcoleus]|uniref:CAP domain-containing protein n=1 Tax=unclassified Microcoleus TaxID=2642155 RepID=UPI002FD0A75F
MRQTLVFLAITTFQVTQVSVVLAQNSSAFEQRMISEINRARENPPAYADWLQRVKQTYDPATRSFQIPGQNSRFGVFGDLAAFDEAISVLKRTSPIPTLRTSNGLGSAAADHAREQSVATSFSQISHTGRDGSSPTDRGNRYGSNTGVWENIGAGLSPEFIVMNLMLDYWEASRGHRKNFLNSTFRLMGVGCGNSSIAGVGKVCVMNFAQEYSENRGNLPNQFPNQTDRPPRDTNQPRQLNLTGEWVIETGSFKFLSNDVNNSCLSAPELGTGYSPITIRQNGSQLILSGVYQRYNNITNSRISGTQFEAIAMFGNLALLRYSGSVSLDGRQITGTIVCGNRGANIPFIMRKS